MKGLRITTGLLAAAILAGSVTLSAFGASVYGDIDGDGAVGNSDVTRLMRHLAGQDVRISETADLDGDGVIGNGDITRLMRLLAGLYKPHTGSVPETPAEELALLDARHDALLAAVADVLPGIVCWGDSLTQGGRVSYPGVLQELIDEAFCDGYDPLSTLSEEARQLAIESGKDYSLSIPVVNMGAGSDTTNTILGRSGAVPFVVATRFTIPAGTESVPISFRSQNGRAINPLTWTNVGMETVTVGGVEGEITGQFGNYSFHRLMPGESTVVRAGTVIETSGSEPYRDHIAIIYMGQNGGFTDMEDFIAQVRQMVEHQTRNSDRYVVIGLHQMAYGQKFSSVMLFRRMEEEFGDHFINLHEYMVTDAMDYMGLTPTRTDLERIKYGYVPVSLLDGDLLHFNAKGYTALAGKVFERLDALGYFDEVRDGIERIKNAE